MERNARIRLQIMLIAVIGGLAFFLYLLVNVLLAATNADRLDQLQNRHFPVIEEIRLLKQDLAGLREALAMAVGLADPVLLEDAAGLAQRARERLANLRQRDPELAAEVEGILNAFEAYAQPAFLLSQALLTNPQRLPEYKSAMEASLRDYELLTGWVNALQTTRQADYQALLQETHLAARTANLWGGVLGLGVILVLGGLAWFISARVVKAINRSDRLKDEFLGTISHELRTPMNGVIGALSLLQSTGLDEDQKDWLEVANRSAGNMMMSIDDLLQFSELMAGQGPLQLGEFRLRTGLEKLLATLRPEFAEKNMTLEFQGGPVLDSVIVSHEARVLYVIRQLLGNALKFAAPDSGQGVVRLVVTPVQPEPAVGSGEIRVLVQDSGPGIAPALQSELLRPFRQLDASFSRQHGGLGIGLANCQAIANLLGGRFSLRNRASGGLEAEFVFPVQFVSVQLPAAMRSAEPGRRTGVVLVVEDNLVNLMVLKGYLKHLGYSALSARNGQQALDLMQSKLVDLVLMDCQMPVLDGYEAVRRIRRLSLPLCETPVVALTANVLEADRQRCLQAGMDGFLKKPVALDEVRAMLEGFLGDAPGPNPS